jgi:hypothetical protein
MDGSLIRPNGVVYPPEMQNLALDQLNDLIKGSSFVHEVACVVKQGATKLRGARAKRRLPGAIWRRSCWSGFSKDLGQVLAKTLVLCIHLGSTAAHAASFLDVLCPFPLHNVCAFQG